MYYLAHGKYCYKKLNILRKIFLQVYTRETLFFVLERKIQLIVHSIRQLLLLFSQVETNLSGALFCFWTKQVMWEINNIFMMEALLVCNICDDKVNKYGHSSTRSVHRLSNKLDISVGNLSERRSFFLYSPFQSISSINLESLLNARSQSRNSFPFTSYFFNFFFTFESVYFQQYSFWNLEY